MVFETFIMSGTIRFGNPVLDRSTFIIDFTMAQKILDMGDGTGELLGYFKTNFYEDSKALKAESAFNETYKESDDEFAPLMVSLRNQNDLGAMKRNVRIMKISITCEHRKSESQKPF